MQVTQYTQQQLVSFKEEFAVRRRRRVLTLLPAIAAVAAIAVLRGSAAVAVLGLPPAVWQPIGIGVLVVAVGFGLLNWRCPACGRYLGRGLNPAFCARCGVALRDRD